ncbi:MAG: class I SAM-dependent methyltransferase [Syntrophobacteraceae bacterium]|jgi:2-polyprenyl-3-methyl-5-hydroxy-6-metoxy-1,4-benzoquinol methylase
MSKQGEINYLRRLGEEGIIHAANKPFSDIDCGQYLAEIGAIMSLLPPPPARLLDFGCGTGWTSCFFAKRGYEVTGVDISVDMIHYANLNKEKECLSNVNFIVGDFESVVTHDAFECVIFYDCLHHAENVLEALSSAYSALKSGGVCIASEPGIFHASNKVAIQHTDAFNVTERSILPIQLKSLARKAGFSNSKVYPHGMLINSIIYPNTFSRSYKPLLHHSVIQLLALMFYLAIYKYLNGIVYLVK